MNRFPLLFLAVAAASAFVPHQPSFGRRSHRSVVGKDHFDMEELRHRITEESNPYQDLFKTKEWNQRAKPDFVNIILFKPDTAEEGVHTVEYPKGSGSNVILAFESMKECGAFAAMLKAQQFFDPTPQEVDLESLESYCTELGVFVQVVPRGMEVLPPTQNVLELGHNPKLKDEKSQLDYLFDMNDSELEEIGLLLEEQEAATDALVGAWE